MDKQKLLNGVSNFNLQKIKEEKELKIRSVLYDLERENFVTASWTLSSLIELKAVEKFIKKLED